MDISPELPQAALDLRDKVRPVGAGFRTSTSWFDPSYCSSGYTVIHDNAVWMLTAAHCIPNYTGSLGTTVYQDGNSSSENIGYIDNNPAWATSGCQSGVDYCADADAALVRYNNAGGYLYAVETTTIGTGNNAGNQTVARYRQVFTHATTLLTGANSYSKTGQTTGTTRGGLDATCEDLKYSDPNTGNTLEAFCTGKGDFRADGGDSGGPVYYPVYVTTDPYDISAVGITIAANSSGDRKMWFSPWWQLESHLGTMNPF